MIGNKFSRLFSAVCLLVFLSAALPHTPLCQRMPEDPPTLLQIWIERLENLRADIEKYKTQLVTSAKDLRELQARLEALQIELSLLSLDLIKSRLSFKSLSRSLEQLRESLASEVARHTRDIVIAIVVSLSAGLLVGAGVVFVLTL